MQDIRPSTTHCGAFPPAQNGVVQTEALITAVICGTTVTLHGVRITQGVPRRSTFYPIPNLYQARAF